MTDRRSRVRSELLPGSRWDRGDRQYPLLAPNIVVFVVWVNWIDSIARLLTPAQIAGLVVFIGTVAWCVGAAYTLLNQDAGLTIRL